jgi:hypothetical protein
MAGKNRVRVREHRRIQRGRIIRVRWHYKPKPHRRC